MVGRPIPCRLKVMHAVYTSNLAKGLRPVALAFAWFADDDGCNVWPSIETVSRMVQSDTRSVRRCLSHLRAMGVLELEDPVKGLHGGAGKSTRYRFNLAVLASLSGSEPGHQRQGSRESKHGHQRQGSATPTLTSVVTNPDISDTEPGQIVHKTLTPVSADPYEPTGTNIEQTDAGASGHSLQTKPIPFRVYASIASGALATSIRDDRSDSISNVLEIFKRMCAQQKLPYTAEISRKAVEAAMHAHAKAKADFETQVRQWPGVRSMA